MTETKVEVFFELPGKLKLFRKLHPAAAEKRKWHQKKSRRDFRSLVKGFQVVALYQGCEAQGPLTLEPTDLRELMNRVRRELAKYDLGLESFRIERERDQHKTPNHDCRKEMSLELTVV